MEMEWLVILVRLRIINSYVVLWSNLVKLPGKLHLVDVQLEDGVLFGGIIGIVYVKEQQKNRHIVVTPHLDLHVVILKHQLIFQI